MRTLLSRVRALFTRNQAERDLSDEVRAHLDLQAADFERRGMTPEAARLAARRAFGGVEQMKETYRERRGVPLVDAVARDVRFGVRLLIKERWFAVVAVLALALGIAVNNTVFTLTNGIMLRDLPFGDPDRIVTIGTAMGGSSRPNAGLSFADVQDFRRTARTFDGLGAASEMTMNLADEGRAPERFIGSYISANAFELIGLAPAFGRAFSEEDDRAGADSVVILGHSVWQNRYASDPAVIGRTIRVNGLPSVVIGVMPEGFGFPVRSRVWQPLGLMPASTLDQRDARSLGGFGRLAPGVTPEQAAAELRGLAAALAKVHPVTNAGAEPRVATFRERGVGGRARTAFPLLMMMVGFVLLIACANVANLQLARAAHRAREIAVRLALGASRAQIIRQLLVESLLLAACAGLAGLALSAVGVRLVSNVFAASDIGLPYWIHFGMDWPVFAFLAAICLGTGLVFGIVPALHSSRPNVVHVLSEAGGTSIGGVRRRRWTTGLVTAQLALAPILLTGGGLMMRSIIAQQQIDPGVATAGIVRMRLDLTGPKYPAPAERARFYRQLEDRLVSATTARAALASHAPFEGAAARRLSIDGQPVVELRTQPVVRMMTIGRGYFATLGTAAVRGRIFTAVDDEPELGSTIVNERFAEVHFPNLDPIGHSITLTALSRDAAPERFTIVGVAPNIRQSSTENAVAIDPVVYVPYVANPIPSSSILVRSDAAPSAVASLMRQHVGAIDPDLALYDIRTLDESLAMSDERIGLRVFGTMLVVFAVIALVLATVGVYTVTAYAITQRTREIGLRVALGAQARQIGWLVTRQVVRQLLIGLSVGMAGGLGLALLMRGLFIGDSAVDPVTLFGVPVLLVLVSLGASFIPARRAMRLNPVTALRSE
jgi:putative ABC transport system permease protein